MSDTVRAHTSTNYRTGYYARPEESKPTKGESWLTRTISRPGHVWGWIVIIIIVILLIAFVTLAAFWEDDNSLGSYGTRVVGKCNGTNSCTDPGVRNVSRHCIPNERTGNGCRIPNGSRAGTISYETLVTTEPCQTHCVNSLWKEITPTDEPCLIDGSQPTRCVVPGRLGTKRRRFRCVKNDDTGVNECTNLKLRAIVGPVDQPSRKLRLRTSNVGEETELDLPCDDFSTTTCGNWEWVVPPPGPIPMEISPQSMTQECTFDIHLEGNPDCIVESNPSNRDNRWENLKEGYRIIPLTCIYDQNNTTFGITPRPTDMPVNQCEILTPPQCKNQGIIPEQIRNGTIPTTVPEDLPDNLLCAGTLVDGQNPTCYNPCRKFLDHAEMPMIDANFQPIFGRALSIRFPSRVGFVGYLAGKHIPSTEENVSPFEDTNSLTVDRLNDVESQVILADSRKRGCTQEATELATATILTLGPRSLDFDGTLHAQMMGLIGSHIGWMGVRNTNLLWQQAYNFYQGPGITSDNPRVVTFQITITSPFTTQDPPFWDGVVGTIGLTIRNSDGSQLFLQDTNGEDYTLDNVRAVIYDINAVNMEHRVDRGPLNCNLLYCRSSQTSFNP